MQFTLPGIDTRKYQGTNFKAISTNLENVEEILGGTMPNAQWLCVLVYVNPCSTTYVNLVLLQFVILLKTYRVHIYHLDTKNNTCFSIGRSIIQWWGVVEYEKVMYIFIVSWKIPIACILFTVSRMKSRGISFLLAMAGKIKFVTTCSYRMNAFPLFDSIPMCLSECWKHVEYYCQFLKEYQLFNSFRW